MSYDTNYKHHCFVDQRITNIFGAELEEEDQIVIEAINSKVDVRNKALDNNETDIVSEEKIDFQKVPRFNDLHNKVKRKSTFGITQHWVGVVEYIEEDSFSAKLEDKSNPGTYEIADFDISEVSPSDKPLLLLGSIFYWSVGFANDNGQIEKRSLLRFKRSVDFSEEDVDRINNEVDQYLNDIKWE